jgi:hypothetical protein
MARDVAVIGVSEMNSSVDHGLEDGVEIERRLGDRLDDVSNGSFTRLRVSLLTEQVGDLIAEWVCVVHGARDRALEGAASLLRRDAAYITLGLTSAILPGPGYVEERAAIASALRRQFAGRTSRAEFAVLRQ